MATGKCVFCEFDKQYIIDENEVAFAAYFDCAIRPGHIVIALKDHVTSLSKLTPEQSAGMMQLASSVAGRAEKFVNCEKFYLVSIADEVPHYHMHLLPKMKGDAPFGSHVMGEDGWRGRVGEPVGEQDIKEFLAAYRSGS